MGANLAGTNSAVDTLLLLHDSTSSIAADAGGLVGGSAAILDLGTGVVRGDLIVDVSAVLATAGNGVALCLQFSSSATFASAIWTSVALTLGDVTIVPGSPSADHSTLGRYVVPFSNEFPMGTAFQYCRIYADIIVNGTITYKARLVLERAV